MTIIVFGDFNMDRSHTQLSAFMGYYNYYNLIKNNACFKGDGSCIDLILANRKYCFKNTSSFETGIKWLPSSYLFDVENNIWEGRIQKSYLSQL